MKDEYKIFRLRKNNILITVSLMCKRTTGKLAPLQVTCNEATH